MNTLVNRSRHIIRFWLIAVVLLSCLRTAFAESAPAFEGEWISTKVLLRGLKITRAEKGYLVQYINYGNGLEYANTTRYSLGSEYDKLNMFTDMRLSIMSMQGEAMQRINYIAANDTLQISGFDFNNRSGNFIDHMSKAMMFSLYGISEEMVVMERLTPSLQAKARDVWEKIHKEESARKAAVYKQIAERQAQEEKVQNLRAIEERKVFLRTAINAVHSSQSLSIAQVLDKTSIEEQLVMIRSASCEELLLFSREEFKSLAEGTTREKTGSSYQEKTTQRRAALIDRIGSKAVELALMPVEDFRRRAAEGGFISNLSPSDITYSVAVEIAARFFNQVPESSPLENVFEPENGMVKRMSRSSSNPEEAMALKNLARRFGG